MNHKFASSGPDKFEGILEKLISSVMRGLPPGVKTEELPARVYDLRQKLIETLLEQHPPQDVEHENFLRETLPPLQVEPGPIRAAFASWRAGINAFVGLLFGAAVAQTAQLAGAFVALAALVGMTASMWLAELAGRKASGHQAKLGGWAIKKVLTWGRRIWFLLLLLAAARDFTQGRDFLNNFIIPLRDFFDSGSAQGLFNNVYWALLFIAVWFLAALRPAALDREEFAMRMRHACRHWWSGAENLAEAMEDKEIAPPSDHREAMASFTQELASFAAELDPVRRGWLEERLDGLGFAAAKSTSTMIWSQCLRETFEPVGYLAEGDCCFIDLPPLYDDDRLIRKGTVRKVRA